MCKEELNILKSKTSGICIQVYMIKARVVCNTIYFTCVKTARSRCPRKGGGPDES